jgi:hypothetical protein
MTARSGQFKSDLSVAVTAEIEAALETAIAFSGIKASQYCRIALVEKLTREKFMRHPGLVYLEKAAAKNPELQAAE